MNPAQRLFSQSHRAPLGIELDTLSIRTTCVCPQGCQSGLHRLHRDGEGIMPRMDWVTLANVLINLAVRSFFKEAEALCGWGV